MALVVERHHSRRDEFGIKPIAKRHVQATASTNSVNDAAAVGAIPLEKAAAVRHYQPEETPEEYHVSMSLLKHHKPAQGMAPRHATTDARRGPAKVGEYGPVRESGHEQLPGVVWSPSALLCCSSWSRRVPCCGRHQPQGTFRSRSANRPLARFARRENLSRRKPHRFPIVVRPTGPAATDA